MSLTINRKDFTPTKHIKAQILSICTVAAVLAYAAFICSLPTQITDVWWQLRLGDEIRINHRIPSIDTYSWSAYHRPIILHEWGSCLAFAEAFRHFGGWGGLLCLEIFVTCATLFSLYRMILRRGSKDYLIALVLTLLAGYVCSTSFTPRPQIFTYLFLTLSLSIFFYAREHKNLLPMLILLAIVQVVWANMHAAAPIFILICLCYAAGDLIDHYFSASTDRKNMSAYFSAMRVPLACAIVSIMSMAVNPNGIGIYHIVTDTIGNRTMPSAINEWQPVDFHNTYGHQIEFYLMFAGIVLSATQTRRNTGDVITICLLTVSALYALRNVPILALAAAPVISPYCKSAFANIKDRLYRTKPENTASSSSLDTTLIAPIMFLLIFMVGASQQLAADKASSQSGSWEECAESIFMVSSQPEDACKFIEAEQFPLTYKMYNDYDNGAYLIWRLRQFPVFVSSETYVYFGPVFDTYVKLEGLPLDWRKHLDSFHPDFVLIGSDDRQSHLFLNAPEWALVYADGKLTDQTQTPVNLIFIRRTPDATGLIQKCRHDCPFVNDVAKMGCASAN